MLPTFDAFHPLGRNGQVADAAEALLFLASDQASFITGVVLPVTAASWPAGSDHQNTNPLIQNVATGVRVCDTEHARRCLSPNGCTCSQHERIVTKGRTSVLPSDFAVHADAEESRTLAR